MPLDAQINKRAIGRKKDLADLEAPGEFENQEVRVAVFLKIMDSGDAGMIERRKHLRFPLKSCDTIGVSRMILRQDFDRDIPSEPGVVRSIHFPHSAAAKQFANLIGAEMGSRREGHVTARIITSAERGIWVLDP